MTGECKRGPLSSLRDKAVNQQSPVPPSPPLPPPTSHQFSICFVCYPRFWFPHPQHVFCIYILLMPLFQVQSGTVPTLTRWRLVCVRVCVHVCLCVCVCSLQSGACLGPHKEYSALRQNMALNHKITGEGGGSVWQ